VTDSDLKAFIDQNPALEKQVGLLKKGYLEVSPSFDPGKNETSIEQLHYNGTEFNLQINRIGPDKIQLVVKSNEAIPLQFNRNWLGAGAGSKPSDAARGSSAIVEVGGDQGTPLRLADGSMGRAVTIDL
jgi:hypothetical protein